MIVQKCQFIMDDSYELKGDDSKELQTNFLCSWWFIVCILLKPTLDHEEENWKINFFLTIL